MEKLKVKAQTIFLTSSTEVERVAKEAYKLKDYEFAAVQECGNDTDHSFTIDGAPDEDDDEEDIELIKRGFRVPLYRNNLLLNLLCKDGIIAPGNYLVQVSW